MHPGMGRKLHTIKNKQTGTRWGVTALICIFEVTALSQ